MNSSRSEMKPKKLAPPLLLKYQPIWVRHAAQIMIRQEWPENQVNSVDAGPRKLYPWAFEKHLIL